MQRPLSHAMKRLSYCSLIPATGFVVTTVDCQAALLCWIIPGCTQAAFLVHLVQEG